MATLNKLKSLRGLIINIAKPYAAFVYCPTLKGGAIKLGHKSMGFS
jgi:hypothetical protein